MIQRTEQEISNFCRGIWPEEYPGCHSLQDFEVTAKVSPRLVVVRVSKMYDAPGFSFELLEKLAKFFGTKNIETASEFHHGGCETCDYGSEYGFELYVRPGDKP